MPVFKVTIKGHRALPTYKPSDNSIHAIDINADIVVSFDVTCKTLNDAAALALSVDGMTALSLSVDAK